MLPLCRQGNKLTMYWQRTTPNFLVNVGGSIVENNLDDFKELLKFRQHYFGKNRSKSEACEY